ncbi:MAG TPA: transaminase [Steroidobacteraceae bacterium]|nr:transaminase [Steroidobacteraceae bacterium]
MKAPPQKSDHRGPARPGAPALDRGRLQKLHAREVQRFVSRHPVSQALHERARQSMVGGVPMPWMARWPGGFPVYVKQAHGSRIVDVDNHGYVDLCLGDTGAMSGHSSAALVHALQARIERGLTMMLPTEDGIWVAEELARRFGLGRWQFTLSATDANRAALRIARQITGRKKILVFSYCYHGTVDEAFAVRHRDGATLSRAGNVGPAVDPASTTRAVEFNDISQLEQALADRSVACVLAEPAMTNMGIVLPAPGYHQALRELTRRHGTLLILDETHTFSAGPGGCTQAWGLDPDMLTIGKAIGGGIPSGALGMAAEVVERLAQQPGCDYEDCGGVGGTLAGNALSAAAMRATLEHVLTAAAFRHMIALATSLRATMERALEARGLPWTVTQLGCRVEYGFLSLPASNGTLAHAGVDRELETYLHLFLLNRGVLITPFHNMALISPASVAADVAVHDRIFTAALDELTLPPADTHDHGPGPANHAH